MARRTRKILFGLLILLLLPVVLVVVAVAALQTASGQNWLVAHVPGWTGGMVTLERPEGAWPQHVKLGRVALTDAQGIWLVIDGIELRWRPLALFSRQVVVKSLEVQKVAVKRAPVSESTAQTRGGGRFDPASLPKLDMRKIAIHEIAIAPEVAGYAQRLKLEGEVANGADGMLAGALRIDTLEGLLTRLVLDAKQTRDGLTAKLEAAEAAGGMVGQMLLLNADQDLHIAGDVALQGEALKTTLAVQEGAREILNLAVDGKGMGAAMQAHLALRGSLPGQLAADPNLAALLQEKPYLLDMTAALQEQAIAWDIASLSAGPLQAKGNGSWPLTPKAKLAADLSVQAGLAELSGLARQSLEGSAALQIAASGTLAQPTAKLDLTVQDLKANAQNYPPLQLVAQLTPKDEETLVLSPFALNAGDVAISGQAQYRLPDSAWQASAQLPATALKTLATLLPPNTLPANYQGNVALTIDAQGKAAEASATVDGGFSAIAGMDAPLKDVLGKDVTLHAEVSHADGSLAWKQATIQSAGGLQLESEGSLAQELNMKAIIRVKDARVLGAGMPGGSPEVNATVTGPMDALKVESTLAWAAPDLPKLTGEIAALVQPEWLTLDKLQLRAADAVVEAKGKYPLGNGAADMAANLRIADLGTVGRYAGQSLSGSAEAAAALKGQALNAKLAVRNLVHPSAKIASLQLVANVADIAKQEGIQAQLLMQQAEGDGWALATTQARLQSQPKAKDARLPPVAFNLVTDGTLQDKPLKLAANGQFRTEKNAQLLEIAQLKGQALGSPMGLDHALQLRMEGAHIALAPTTLRFGALVVQARWEQSPNALNGALVLAPVELKKLPGVSSGLPDGTLEANVKASGTPAAPLLVVLAKGQMKLQEESVPPLNWQADVDWQGGAGQTPLHVKLVADAGTDAKINAAIATRGRFQLEPMAIDLPPSAPLQGQAQLSVLLEMLNPWLRGQGHKLAGKADGTIQLGGTIEKPAPQGAIALNGVRYDHLTSGLCIQGLSGQIQASPHMLTLSGLTGKDPHGGNMQLGGGVQLASPMRTDVTFSAKNYQMFCGGMLTGAMAGDLKAQGNVQGDLHVDGTLVVGPLSVNLPESNGASGIPQVKILNEERAKEAATAKRANQAESNIALNIVVDASVGRIFVRGRGLDAEFAGKLNVGGTANKPDVVGQLSTKRGKFNLLERQLQLTEGTLRFEGAIPPSPSMKIVAESKASDATAQVTLEGSAMEPKLTLSSTPALPQDEVLARLLFGRDLQSISPYQALQLARAAQQLSGKGGGGPDVLGKIRGALGLDNLSVDQDSAGETTLGTGKYLADGVYVGVEQGRTPESRRIKTELEVIPNITVQTMTGSKGETGGGVEWKYDY